MAKELSKDQIASVLEKAQAQKQRTRGKSMITHSEQFPTGSQFHTVWILH